MENKIDAMQMMLNARVATVPPISSQIPVNYDHLCQLTPDDNLEFPACAEKIKVSPSSIEWLIAMECHSNNEMWL